MSELCDGVDLLGCLDGTASAEDRAHVESCEHCRRERDALARQVRVLTVHFRGSGPCPSPERLVEAAEAGVSDDVNLADHFNACADCATEWKRIRKALTDTESIESGPVSLPATLSSAVAESRTRGKLIDKKERFRKPSAAKADERLPAAAQPEDLTDASDEAASRERDDDREDSDD